jgi:hypothetical protein
MIRRRSALLTVPALGGLLAGCASRREMPFNATLFPQLSAPQDAQLPGRVAVMLQPALEQLVHEGDDGPAKRLRIPVGRIVAEAVLRAAGKEFLGGSLQLNTPADARMGDGLAATLVVQSVRVTYQSHLLWIVPLPLLGGAGDWELDLHLALDMTLLDPQGQAVWTRSYDDGRQVWKHDWTEQYKAPDGLLRLTHEAAWRLAQQAVHDLADWVRAERLRPRSL